MWYSCLSKLYRRSPLCSKGCGEGHNLVLIYVDCNQGRSPVPEGTLPPTFVISKDKYVHFSKGMIFSFIRMEGKCCEGKKWSPCSAPLKINRQKTATQPIFRKRRRRKTKFGYKPQSLSWYSSLQKMQKLKKKCRNSRNCRSRRKLLKTVIVCEKCKNELNEDKCLSILCTTKWHRTVVW